MAFSDPWVFVELRWIENIAFNQRSYPNNQRRLIDRLDFYQPVEVARVLKSISGI